MIGITYDTAMKIVIDTNVLIAAVRSRRGASFKLLSIIGSNAFCYVLSVPLLFEYEDVLYRSGLGITLSDNAKKSILNRLCFFAECREIYFLWRPHLKDPKDDMVLELAVESNCTHIVTFNQRDFLGVAEFGIKTITPREFLELLQ